LRDAAYGAVCIFVNDTCDADVLTALHRSGTRLVALLTSWLF
jgi:D-lactate dehydrogenase